MVMELENKEILVLIFINIYFIIIIRFCFIVITDSFYFIETILIFNKTLLFLINKKEVTSIKKEIKIITIIKITNIK